MDINYFKIKYEPFEEQHGFELNGDVIYQFLKRSEFNGPLSISQMLSKKENELDEVFHKAIQLPGIFRRIREVKSEITKIEKFLSELWIKRSSLGIFAGKQKKEIDLEINRLSKKKEDLQNELKNLHTMATPYSTENDIKNRAAALEAEIKMLKEHSLRISNYSNPLWDENTLYQNLLNERTLTYILSCIEIADIFLADPTVKSFVNMHPTCFEECFSKNIPTEIVKQIEHLEFWKINSFEDTRTEHDLVECLSEYFTNSVVLRDYSIERNVSPAVMDADAALRKRFPYLSETIINGERYSANKYGKPIQFLFIKDGKPCLAISIGKDSQLKHNLVRWAKYACEDLEIPYLAFRVGKPNTKHYVLRNVYEKLQVTEPYKTE